MSDTGLFELLAHSPVAAPRVEPLDGGLSVEDERLEPSALRGGLDGVHQSSAEPFTAVRLEDGDALDLPAGLALVRPQSGGADGAVAVEGDEVCRPVEAVVLVDLQFGRDALFLDEHPLADRERRREFLVGLDALDPSCHARLFCERVYESHARRAASTGADSAEATPLFGAR